MLWLYRILFLPVMVVLAPRYLWRMRKRGGYGAKFAQRFGGHEELPAKKPGVRRIWLQAVSVGEMLAIGPVLEALQRDGQRGEGTPPPHGVEIYLTTTTSTGYRVAQERYAGSVAGVGYFPIDWWWFSRRAWKRIEPDLVILTEGERWPEHLHQANVRGVPVIAINARMSDRTIRRLKRFPFAARAVLGGLTRVLPGSARDEKRFRELGVAAERLTMTGNIKLDVRIAPLADGEWTRLRRELGFRDGLIVLGSSTWPGEEAALIEAWRAAKAAGAAASLLLVPRHAERRGEIERLLQAAKVTFHLRSRGAADGPVDVTVGDTTGELRKLTQLADLVFVGKSLLRNEGGQTPVEAAALRKPILFGPAMSNFRAIADELLACGAAIEVADAAALSERVAELLGDAVKREAMAAAAENWQRENAGAVERTVAVIREELARLG
ncbi:MAG TPA: glycosyltransferase N-terminal domain-containing protein [Opitutus sp.]|nr:glycosyltransferase N-terminal domain-containing protein [Opitutus sp.]